MPAKPDPANAGETFQAKETFFVAVKGDQVARTVPRGSFIAADDPIVKTHRALLVPVSELVERATAGPGERRNVHIPSPEES